MSNCNIVHLQTVTSNTYVCNILLCIVTSATLIVTVITSIALNCDKINILACISLGTLVPNSRDRHEKQWRPDFTRHKTHPKIRFV